MFFCKVCRCSLNIYLGPAASWFSVCRCQCGFMDSQIPYDHVQKPGWERQSAVLLPDLLIKYVVFLNLDSILHNARLLQAIKEFWVFSPLWSWDTEAPQNSVTILRTLPELNGMNAYFVHHLHFLTVIFQRAWHPHALASPEASHTNVTSVAWCCGSKVQGRALLCAGPPLHMQMMPWRVSLAFMRQKIPRRTHRWFFRDA